MAQYKLYQTHGDNLLFAWDGYKWRRKKEWEEYHEYIKNRKLIKVVPSDVPAEFQPKKNPLTYSSMEKLSIDYTNLVDKFILLYGESALHYYRTSPSVNPNCGIVSVGTDYYLMCNTALTSSHKKSIGSKAKNRSIQSRALGSKFMNFWEETNGWYGKRKVNFETLTRGVILSNIISYRNNLANKITPLVEFGEKIISAYENNKDYLPTISNFHLAFYEGSVNICARLSGCLLNNYIIGPGNLEISYSVKSQRLTYNDLTISTASSYKVNPHINRGQGGVLCLGDANYDIMAALSRKDIVTVLCLLQEYYRSVDFGDAWGSNIREYPRALVVADYTQGPLYLPDYNQIKDVDIKNMGVSPQAYATAYFIYSHVIYPKEDYICAKGFNEPIRRGEEIVLPTYVSKEMLTRDTAWGYLRDIFSSLEEFHKWRRSVLEAGEQEGNS